MLFLWEQFIPFCIKTYKVSNSKIIYSTDNSVNIANDHPIENEVNISEQKVRLHLDRKRGGKVVTIVRGLIHDSDKMLSLTKELKKKCGVGGTYKEKEILIQGNKRDIVKGILIEKGYDVKLSGG